MEAVGVSWHGDSKSINLLVTPDTSHHNLVTPEQAWRNKGTEASPTKHTGWLGCAFTGSPVDKLQASCFLALDKPNNYG